MTPDQEAMTAAFWRWLAPRAHRMAELVDGDAPFWDEILAQLQAIDPGLWLEVGGQAVGEELVLTAGGNPDLFELVDAICAQAPAMPGWRVVALKPPLGFNLRQLTYEGVRVEPKALWFKTLDIGLPDIIGLRVAAPGHSAETNDRHCMAVLLLLDSALGEREAARSIHVVEVVAPPPDPDAAGYLPMVDLGAFLAWRHKRAASQVH